MLPLATPSATPSPQLCLLVNEPARPPWPAAETGEDFWRAIDALLDRDGPSRTRNREIARRQAVLQGIVTEDAWREYLLLEDAQSRRCLRWLWLVAQWAHEEGRRSTTSEADSTATRGRRRGTR